MATATYEVAEFNDGKSQIWLDYDDVTLVINNVRWITDRPATVNITVAGQTATFSATGNGSQAISGNRYKMNANGTPAFNIQIAY